MIEAHRSEEEETVLFQLILDWRIQTKLMWGRMVLTTGLIRQHWLVSSLVLLLASAVSATSLETPQPQALESFKDYRQRVEIHVRAQKQWINPQNTQQELDAVLPFELERAASCSGPSVGVLLSHGLSDSPYSMRSIAHALHRACLHVQVILLPGHGTQADALLRVSRTDWRQTFATAARNLSHKVDRLYVGGFSTGGALALEYALAQPQKVSGVMLFSPVFKINSQIDWLSPWLAPFVDWLDQPQADDYAKYAAIPVPAIAQVYHLSKEVGELVRETPAAGQIPVFMALSLEDATVDSQVSVTYFRDYLVDTRSKMLLYSQYLASQQLPRETVQNAFLPELRIQSLSHMAVHMDPQDRHYGQTGDYRVCDWYVGQVNLWLSCQQDEQNWFGEKSAELTAHSAHAARISWNPFFSQLVDEMVDFIDRTQLP